MAWIVSWIAAAVWASRTVGRPGGGREWPYRILEVGGLFLLLAPLRYRNPMSDDQGNPAQTLLAQHFWSLPPEAGWIMVGLAVAGFLFCWWARLHLGRLWSGRITRKEGHHVVDTGPYAIVRHPIYTGILLASAATAAVVGSGYAIAGFALLIGGYWMKARLEERFLREELGAQAYDAYARKTAMLIPFVRV
jgi:protein-S-isoprenylcysteine O-methyltransferase Ste14